MWEIRYNEFKICVRQISCDLHRIKSVIAKQYHKSHLLIIRAVPSLCIENHKTLYIPLLPTLTIPDIYTNHNFLFVSLISPSSRDFSSFIPSYTLVKGTVETRNCQGSATWVERNRIGELAWIELEGRLRGVELVSIEIIFRAEIYAFPEASR